MKKIKAGVIGGGNIAEFHLNDMVKNENIIPYALCDVNQESLDKTGDRYNIPKENRYTDYKELLARSDIDMVSICTPNVTHFSIAMDTVKSGKAYVLEKPVAMTLVEAKELYLATKNAGLTNAVGFSYRYLPAVQKAKEIISSGALGKIHHVYAQYIEGKDDNENIPLLWRYQKELAGSGSLGDLGSHMLDMMRYLVGDFNEVIGTSGIIIPKRQKLDGSGLGDVTTEDYFHAMATMENDISATMCFTKFAWGRKNSQRLEIYGSRGGLIYTLENGLRGSDHLKVCLGNELALTGDWVDMNLKGFDGVYNTKSQMDCFAEKMLGIKNTIPADIEDGYYVQGIIEAMMNSTQSRTWHKVSDYIIK